MRVAVVPGGNDVLAVPARPNRGLAFILILKSLPALIGGPGVPKGSIAPLSLAPVPIAPVAPLPAPPTPDRPINRLQHLLCDELLASFSPDDELCLAVEKLLRILVDETTLLVVPRKARLAPRDNLDQATIVKPNVLLNPIERKLFTQGLHIREHTSTLSSAMEVDLGIPLGSRIYNMHVRYLL
jgi:hypothetical protein